MPALIGARSFTAAAILAALVLGTGPSPSRAAGTPPAAPAGEAPSFVGGIYAQPSCAAPEEVSLETRRFGLSRHADGTVSGYRYESFAPAGSWVRIQTNRGASYQRMGAPDSLQVAFYRGTRPLAADFVPGEDLQSSEWSLTTYQRCDTLPAPLRLIHGEAAAAMNALDRIDRNCTGEPSDACGAMVLAAMDVNGDEFVSLAELSRLARVALYLAAASETIGGGATIEEEALLGAQAGGILVAPFVARAVLESYDYDADELLSPAEMLQDRGEMDGLAAGELAAAPGRPEVMQALGQLRALGDLVEALLR